MRKINRERRQAAHRRASTLRKRDVGLPTESSTLQLPQCRGNRRRNMFGILVINTITIAQIVLLCSNIPYSHSLIRDAQIPSVPSTVSTAKRRRNRGLLRPFSALSSSTDTVPLETNTVPTNKSFASSVKINYKPNRQYNKKYHRDFRTHEDQERVHLDWMVRNTAKILGEDASPPGEMTNQMVKITHSLMQVWARRAAVIRSSDAPHVVEKLLQRLLLEKRTVDNGSDTNDEKKQIEINLEHYNAVLQAWSHSNDPISAERAEQILLKMEEEQEPKPNCASYNAVIKALVKNGCRASGVDKVEELVLKMDATEDINIMPDRRSYNLLLYAIANSNRDDAAERATKHLERMISRYQSSTPEELRVCPIQPDVNSFNQVIGAWARGKTADYLEQMEKVFGLMLELAPKLNVKPSVNTYNALMGGWLKSNDDKALLKIQEYFSTMEEDYKNGNKSAQPDRVSANTLQTALNRFSRGNIDTEQLKVLDEYDIPRNSLSQNILIEGLIKSGVGDAPEKANGILTEMEKSFLDGDLDMKPDECSYSAVIKAYVTYNRKNTERKAEDLLGRMWELHRSHDGNRPNVNVYNSVMNAYASIKSTRTVKKAKELLATMESGETEGLPKPNLITYNTAIKAMRNGNKEEGAIIAENILSRLECLGKDDPELLPDNYTYTSVITAHGRSSSPKKAEKALEIIQRMADAQKNGNGNAVVTTHTFNAALNSCAFVDGSNEEKARAFEIATTLDNLRIKSGKKADSTWYGTMLRACSTLIPPSNERQNQVDLVFRDACENGCVGRLVLQQLKFAADREQQMRLLNKKFEEGEYVQANELQEEWTRHTKREWETPYFRKN